MVVQSKMLPNRREEYGLQVVAFPALVIWMRFSVFMTFLNDWNLVISDVKNILDMLLILLTISKALERSRTNHFRPFGYSDII